MSGGHALRAGVLGFLAVALIPASATTTEPPAAPRGPYLGETPPGETPKVFAPGFLSQPGRMERALAFSTDGTEAFFAVTSPDFRPTLFHTRQIAGEWTEPVIASFAREGNNTEPAFAADGQRVYFASNRPPGAAPFQFDLWVAERDGLDWGTPTRLGPPISSSFMEYHPTISAAGTLCFASDRTGSPDLFCARATDAGFGEAEPLDDLNTEHQEWDPFIAPDESFIMFKSDRPGGLGGMDGYVAFRTSDGRWGTPHLIPAPINTPGGDDVGDVSPDGQYVIFARRDGDEMDVYWVASSAVLGLRDAHPR